jgi:alcohol dehydrogenase class IV
VALIWDHEAIMATPFKMMEGFCVNGYIGSALGAARRPLNPLQEADSNHINLLHRRAYKRMLESPNTIDWRIDLFVAAFLGNRSADDAQRGVHIREGATFDGDYGINTALHIKYPHVWQQDAGSATRPTLIRRSRTPSLELLDAIAMQLGIHSPERSPHDTQMEIADEIERIYKRHGMPTSIRELNVPKEDFEAIARDSVKIFNSNAGMRDEESHMKNAVALLEAAW